MKSPRFELFAWGAVFVVLSLFVAVLLIQGGTVNYLKVAAMLSPFIFIIFLRYRTHWHIWIFAFLVMQDIVLPIYGIQKFTPEFILLLVISVATFVDKAIAADRKKVFYPYRRVVFVLACIVTARIIYERPGFVALGASTGGLIKGLFYTLPLWFYFPIQKVVKFAVFTRKQLVLVMVLAGVTNLSMIFLSSKSGHMEMFWLRRMVNEPAWLFCATSLSLLVTSSDERKRLVWFYFLSIYYLGIALLSTYRSRMFFFLAEILAISYFSRRFKQIGLTIIITAIVAIVALIPAIGQLPPSAQRALSLFVSTEYSEVADEYKGGALGWQDDFRGQLYTLAWESIREKPFVGHGFGLEVEAARDIVAVSDQTTQIELLALNKSYHNSIVGLADAAGLPAALLFLYLFVRIPIDFGKKVKRETDVDKKAWGMSIITFWIASAFMNLMNGGYAHFFTNMVTLALMAGFGRWHLGSTSTEPAEIKNEADSRDPFLTRRGGKPTEMARNSSTRRMHSKVMPG